jgi:hypothetical protein
MVAERTYPGFIYFIQRELSGYDKRGTISGDRSIDGKIHYRYEYGKPPSELPEGGVSPGEVRKFYKGSDAGFYRLPGMEDLHF